ncbi:hypothetical protein ACROYT_G013542 [Oculina patagonica]
MERGRPVKLPVTRHIEAKAPFCQPVQPGQRIYVQSFPGQQEQPQAGQELGLAIDTDFLKSHRCHMKKAEFVALLGAWTSIVKYFDKLHQLNMHDTADGQEATLFKFVTILCWVMVILYLIIYTFSVPKLCKWRRPSVLTLMSLIFHFIIFALLLGCTGKLVYRTAYFGYWFQKDGQDEEDKGILTLLRPLVECLAVASAFGFISCIVFVVDMVLSYKFFQTQRAQETSPDQGPSQRKAWDVKKDYIRSPVFYVKLAETALLFAAWLCIVKYFADITTTLPNSSFLRARQVADFKADFFKGVAIFSWVMVILLAMTSVLSFDKLCGRSSPWTLTTVFIYLILFVLLITSCANLTPRAVGLKKHEERLLKIYRDEPIKLNILSVQIGLACGFLCCILFVVDMVLSFKLYLTQRAQETSIDHGPYQRKAGHVNPKYLRSPMFYVKFAEIVRCKAFSDF